MDAKTRASITKSIATAQRELKNAYKSSKNFWDAAMLVDADLLDALFKGQIENKRVDAIADKYKEVAKLASPREFLSVLDQTDFLIEMAENNERVFNALTRLRREMGNTPG
jgi:hypothetical protein